MQMSLAAESSSISDLKTLSGWDGIAKVGDVGVSMEMQMQDEIMIKR
jgi:hypothetical protein